MAEETIEGFQLSPAQKHLWRQAKGDVGPHRATCVLSLAGELDAEALVRALAGIVARYEVLRTTFHRIAGMALPLQVVGEEPRFVLERHDGIGFAADRGEELGRIIEALFKLPIDLTEGPLLQAVLLARSSASHLLALSLPALCADRATLAGLCRELASTYETESGSRIETEAAADGKTPEPLQYVDYSVWQNELLEAEDTEEGRAFWRTVDRSGLATLELPYESRPKTPFSPLTLTREAGSVAAIEAAARHCGVGLAAFLLACWQALLWRLTERSDLVLGILFEGRGFAELEGTAGLLARFLPCSSRPAEGMSLRQLAVRTQKALGDAEPWQESFSWDSSGESAANAASEPYLPFCFELIDEDALSYAGGGLTFTVDQLRACIDRFKVNLRYLRHGDELVFELDFDASLLTRSAADVLADQCAQMLASATSDPELLLGDLALVGPRERNLLQVEFQDARPSAGGEERIQDLISGRSRRASEDVAVICGEVELTYGELMLRASTLAARLRACGVGAEVRVGVLCEPSPEMIVTILAILEAGGAYVPLDPGYPMERLAFILEDCGASVLVTTERLAGKLPEHRALVVVLDLPAESETGSVALRKDATSADNAAYVIYTSGSTGRPKGVVVSHRSLVSSTKARSIYYREPVSRFLLASSFAFDSSVAGIFWTLADGGSLLIWSDPSRLELAALIDLLARRQASHLLCLPSLWAEVLRQAERSRLVSLRAVIVAGESCLPDLVDRHFQVLPQTLLFNEYGPTEATVWSSVHLARPEDAAGRVPIGRPIPGIQIHLLDSDLRLVPIGTPGELYIGGAGVARGYLGHLDLTAARFCPDSLSERAGERLYRTGDLARWRPDGTLDFLGRVDHQVKIRGFRIEPGEIEALLVSHPGVHAAVVVAREDAGSEKRLVAYLVPTAGDVGVDECRDLVSSHLPAFMVPAAWVVLPELPLTPNGKVDRKALPPPADAGASVRSIYVQPRTPIEEILCTLWSEVLGVDQVGVRDDFFALGGHSLIATRVAARLNKVLGVDLPVRTLFRATTVEDLSREVESAMRSGNGLAMPPLRRLSRQKLLPLSFAQERLWFVHQLVPASTAYNIPLGLRIEGALRVEALAAALREIARRHEILRTTFTVAGGVPAQSISPEVSVALPVVDLGSLPEMAAAKEEERLSQAEAARPFDLGCGPLLRFTLLHRGTECHVILMSVHHIVFDGSFEVFLKELGAIYRALLQDRPSPLSELPVQYVDFAQWQREWLRGETLERLLSFWKDQLRGAQATVNLPADRPRPLVQGFRGSQRRAQVSGPLVGRLVALARQESVTLFMVGLAAFQALLHRYSGQNDLSVGSPVLDRPALEAEDLIGCFVNTLVMRAPVSGGSVFREHLARVREVALDAYAHRHLPFEMLVQALQPDRSLSRSPLFQVMFVLQSVSAHEPAVDLHGLRVSLLEPSSQAARFDFLLSVWHGLQGLKVNLEYDSDLFDASTAERMVSHFVRLLELVVSEVETSVSSLVLLSAGERHQLLWEWNDTLEPVGEVSIQDLVEAQVLRTPGALAVVSDEESLSYWELNRRANGLAHHLRSLGVGVGSLVGVYLERSAAMVPVLLGVLKSGGAYVPIDPSYPAARVEWILSSLGVRWVVSDSPRVEGLASVRSLEHVVRVDAGEGEREENPVVGCTAADLAYVIFTSGSTGRPKGVVVRHGPVVNLLGWVGRRFGIGAGDRGLFITSLCFDLSVYDIFGLLSSGGTVRVAGEEAVRDPERLLALLEGEAITFWDSAPAALQQLVPFFTLRGASSRARLRLVFLSGDWIPVGLPEEVRSRYPGSQVVSFGGATEAAVWSNVYPIGEVQREWRSIPYGRPIGNARYLILDEESELCAIGVPGDLYIGGECLASGYAGEAGLTAERFVPSGFGGEPGERLYRTGDRARFWRDGTMEFLGRRDQQVKVRGFRVELGEIESSLGEHPGVSEAVVSAWQDSSGHKRLVAYVVGREGVSPESAELRRYLSERLPSYMVPSVYVALESLPVTANGKLDRRALPSPEETREDSRSYTAPRNPVEELLADIWAEVLRLDRVGIHDNFFEIGGHSLLAVRAVARIREVLGFEVFLRSFFEAPTVSQLTARIGTADSPDRSEVRQPISRISREGELPLSFGQQRLWFLDLLEPASPLYNLPVALRLRGPLDPAVLEKVLTELVRRHESLRTIFPPVAGQPVQTILPPAPVSLATIDLNSLGCHLEVELLALAAADARRAFDLAAGPLFRASVVKLGREDHAILLGLHHIVGDGVSMGVLLKELGELYAAFAAGNPSPLPDLPIQYADFASWQRRNLGDILARGLALSKARLAYLPPLELPTDRPRPAEQRFFGATQRLVIAAGTVAAVREIGRREGVTPFMVLLGGLGALLGMLGRQENVIVGSPIAGRSRPETEGLIGFFVNTLVLPLDLSAAPKVHDLLARVRETCLAAYDSQDVPFERLVEELRPGRDLSRSPLFQAMLALEPELRVPPLPRIDAEYLGLDTGTSKLDLLLSLSQPSDRFEGSWEFDTDLFDRVTIQRWSASFQTLLATMSADPSLPIAELPLLSAAQRQQMVHEWQGAPERGRLGCLHQSFFVQAGLTPEAVAVVAGETRITYGELARSARFLARRLCRLGVGPEVPVGLCVDRTPELLVGVLGVLAAGGAYLPLDPAYPAAHLAFALEDSRAPIVLASATTLDRLPPSRARIVRLDAEEAPSANGGSAVVSGVGPGNLSHVIYTSGSTGRPKGVAIEHRSGLALVTWAEGVFTAEEVSRVLFSTSICFDLSIFELFVPWSRGGAVVLAETALQLPELPARDEVTLINTVPSIMSELVRNGGVPGAVRVINLAGEPLREDLVRSLEQLGTVEKVFNLYGPTEDTTYSTWVRVDGKPGAPTIGRPIGGTRAYVADGCLELLPPGVIGELCLGGLGLTRGYLGRPELTAERFVPDPFASASGERLYRTGDLCRLRSDGEIELLGRLDHQVKLRGFRVELGEIEAVLATCPGVREGAVLVKESAKSGAFLVAYVVVEEADAGTAAALRRLLEEKLPSHMVPSAYMFLVALPRTPNGKLDRKALPAPDIPRSAAAPMAPETASEELLSGIWADVLGCEKIGREDDFFALGGHSLLATRVLSRIRQIFRVELPLRAVFLQPTLAGLARSIEQAEGSRTGEPQPPIVAIPRHGDLPLSFAQQRLWTVDQIERGALYNVPIAVHLRGQLHATAFRKALEEIIRRHEVLRTTFPADQGRPRQRISPAVSPWQLPMVDLAGLEPVHREAESANLAAAEAVRLFDLSLGPLLRTTLLRLERESHIALITMHHIVADAWSVGILIRELTALYRTGIDEQPAVLPNLPIQYADFAAWQRLMLQGEALQSLLSYWREQLSGIPPRLDLPTDRPRGERWSGRGSAHTVHLSAGLAGELRSLSRRQNATLFMVLFAGFQLLLSRLARQTDIVVATDVAGRTRLEIEPLIGFFVNLLVLRTRMEDNPLVTELLQRVRDTSLGAYAHQDLPFDRLVKDLQPDRPAGGTPLVQVELLMQNTPSEQLALPGLELSLIDGETRWAKFDLAVFVSEEPQGLNITWNYASDLFDPKTVARWASQYARLLEALVRRPESRIADLEVLSEEEKAERALQKGGRETKLRQLMQTGRTETPTGAQVDFSTVEPGKILPLVVRPLADVVDLAGWVAGNRKLIESRLLQHGAILFRDFSLGSAADFERLAGTLCSQLPGYRNNLFFGAQVALEGDEMQLIDCREAFRRLDSRTVDHLRHKQILCLRSYSMGSAMSWQSWFGTDDKSVVEDLCRRTGIAVEWLAGNGALTKQLCFAVIRHPETAEEVLFHPLLLPEDLPCTVRYEDGSPIESWVKEEIGRAYEESTVTFRCRNGDVVLLDNVLTVQGQDPFMGPRKIVVARADLIGRSQMTDAVTAVQD